MGRRERVTLTFPPFILVEILKGSSLECYPICTWRLIHIKMENFNTMIYNVSSKLVEHLTYLLKKQGQIPRPRHVRPLEQHSLVISHTGRATIVHSVLGEPTVICQVHTSTCSCTPTMGFHVSKLHA